MASVLVADNDSIARGQYISGLQQAGHSVTGASSAQATLDAIDEIKPDIIVLDIVLSVHNGITVLFEMMSYNDWSRIPVIILSSIPKADFANSDDIWKRLNVVSYCHKPTTRPAQLADIVSEQIK